jgi:UPF0716 family protein affecting phage T7 exclusion
MSLVKWGFVGLLALPLAEVATFLLVALAIGWLWTMAACLATSTIGVMLLRRSGRTDLDDFLAALARDGVRAIHLESPGVATLIGAFLLVLPGFITDFLGALLFLPAFRQRARAKISHARSQRRNVPGRTVIDLPHDQWRQLPNRPPDRKRRRKHRS